MSQIHARPFLSTALLSALLCTLPPGCKSSETHDEAAATATSVVEVGGDAGQVQLHLDQTLTALEQVSATGAQDPKPAFDTFKSGLETYSSHLADLMQDRTAFTDRARNWLDDFSKRNEAIGDEDLRKAGAKRIAEFSEQVGDITKKVDELVTDSKAIESRLTDLRTFLGNDLTPKAVETASGRIKDVSKDGRKIAERWGQLSKSSEAMGAELRSAQTPPPAK
jgi:hypothetical protein